MSSYGGHPVGADEPLDDDPRFKATHLAGNAFDCEGCAWIRFRNAVEDSWSWETSANEEWSHANPGLGQCAVTALVVQDAHGGDLVRTVNEGVSHYFNRLPNGVEIDLTRKQFHSWDPSPYEIKTREYVLSFAPTRVRYDLLATRVRVKIGMNE